MGEFDETQKMWFYSVDWIRLSQGEVNWRALVITVESTCSLNGGDFLHLLKVS